ncbi:nuclear transport factor 2 family protein [Ktedonospora formicarum]|uniref:SnoaL-like domain-containing protein n=1 Tax=Ktedonospora formicarum TaxID=2778364 RepID=A0A8J3MSY2_9CHLR|nr:nuclear transport factor 2 family protein [Ktedonospora formicarum]GHO47592.1 hypothetical protein KSX_57550 [Ktedonospora formicarum]
MGSTQAIDQKDKHHSAEGNKVALRVTVHGVPTPPGEPLPLILEIFRIENGRVAEIWGAGTLRRPDA